MKRYYEIYDKTKKYKNTVCLVDDEDIAKDFCLNSEVYDYVERVMSPCGDCEAQVDPSEAKNYCDMCKANNYSHYFANDNIGVSLSNQNKSDIWNDDISKDNREEKIQLAIKSIDKLELNTAGWGAETGLIKQVLTDFYNLNTELMNKDYQINALVSLVKELGFEEFIVNQYDELYGYSYNGFSSNEKPTDEQIERFNTLKDLLPVKKIKAWQEIYAHYFMKKQ
jgi:hypothetical protein